VTDPFTPTRVDRAAATAWVTEQANQLAPGAVDEALGHALDNIINAQADQWVAQVNSEFAQYEGELRFQRDRADSDVAYQARLQPPDTHRAIEVETARNAAALRLRGENEKAAWPEPGHADPTMLAGRSAGRYVYVLALILGAAADMTAFYQVLLVVQGQLTPREVQVLVVAFSGIALFAAHFAGTMLRDRTAGAKWIQLFMIFLCAVTWASLGAVAFWVRLNGHMSTGSGVPNLNVGGAAAGSTTISSQNTAASALMFAALYATTGAVTLVGSYLTHNPLHGALARAVRQHRGAAKRNAQAAKRLGDAEARRGFFNSQLAAAEQVRNEAVKSRHALAAELKQVARLEIAKRLRDASATDAFLANDARPYLYRPFPN
jgi:hypothetical protein